MNITLATTLFAVIKIFLISLGGYIIVKKGLVSRDSVTDLARLVLYLPLPALAFVSMFDRFEASRLIEAAAVPLSCIILFGIAGLIGLAGAFLLGIEKENRSAFYAMSIFGNSGYIPIPLVMGILPEQKAEEAVVLIFLFIMAFSPFLWSVGVFLVAKKPDVKFPVRRMISPPLVGILGGLSCAFIMPVRDFLENGGSFLLESLRLLSKATVPMVMVILGGILAGMKVKRGLNKKFIAGVFTVRMLILPGVVIPILYFLPLPNMVKFVIAIESMVPSATNLVVIARTYHRPADLISMTIFTTYLLALITFPIIIFIVTRLFPLG